MIISVKVLPKSSRDQIIHSGNNYRIKITTAPEKGRANTQVIKLLAQEFRVAPSRVKIIKGLTGHNKLIKIDL